ncbi:GGDEF domain-containing protein [Sphingomonas sp. IC4-52]|uniref:GGDEF domain-containing protein n=1 Tax=Sphingomonas sp. IC4-52 TaxID=2887202 RepID=UPI001D0FA423|nr:GGDEF domain-containing protein [Sphingomonas sp. IC4-52]MCC2981195.1 GGDEF domain-containing protein [Sphingomonas sp. IC4-52]
MDLWRGKSNPARPGTPPGFRYGGEEFLIILTGSTPADAAAMTKRAADGLHGGPLTRYLCSVPYDRRRFSLAGLTTK